MTGYTYGIYIVCDTENVPATGDTLGTEGQDWIKLSNKGMYTHNVACQPSVIDVPGGSAYAINLGTFSEKIMIQDKPDRTAFDLVLKFIKYNSQPTRSPFLYFVVCTNSTGPVLMDFYRNSTTPADYLPVVIESMNSSWSEQSQHHEVTITLTGVWE